MFLYCTRSITTYITIKQTFSQTFSEKSVCLYGLMLDISLNIIFSFVFSFNIQLRVRVTPVEHPIHEQDGLVPVRYRRNAMADIFQGLHPRQARDHLLTVTSDATDSDSDVTATSPNQELLDIVHSGRFWRRRNALHDLGLGEHGLHIPNHVM